MVDIAMCKRKDCPKRMNCFRYIADAEEFGQSYLVFEQLPDNCEMYWRVRNSKELRYMNRVNR